MKLPKFFIIVTESIKEKELENVSFLFPLKNFCVGFQDTYELKEITAKHSYLYLNRLLDTESIALLAKTIKKLPKNIEGIVFEDLGVYELIKKRKLTKILYAQHANCSINTINTYLEKVDSVVISPDITLEETKEILKKASKPLIVYGLGHLSYMYSRRYLNTNYANHFSYQPKQILPLKETITKMPFIAVENEYGTVLYDDKIYYAKELLNEENVLGFLINPFLINQDASKIIESFQKDELNNNTKGFLYQKTIKKLKKDEN